MGLLQKATMAIGKRNFRKNHPEYAQILDYGIPMLLSINPVIRETATKMITFPSTIYDPMTEIRRQLDGYDYILSEYEEFEIACMVFEDANVNPYSVTKTILTKHGKNPLPKSTWTIANEKEY